MASKSVRKQLICKREEEEERWTFLKEFHGFGGEYCPLEAPKISSGISGQTCRDLVGLILMPHARVIGIANWVLFGLKTFQFEVGQTLECRQNFFLCIFRACHSREPQATIFFSCGRGFFKRQDSRFVGDGLILYTHLSVDVDSRVLPEQIRVAKTSSLVFLVTSQSMASFWPFQTNVS